MFIASPLRTQLEGENAKTGGHGMRIMCLSAVTCLPSDCCFNELLYKNPTKHVGLVQSGQSLSSH